MERLSSYSHVLNLGHRALDPLLTVPVVAEEKIDGSQISFGRVGDDVIVRSKGADIPVPAPAGHMFRVGVEEILKRREALIPGWTYRGEYLSKPKHNVMAYSMLPSGNIVLFDIETEPSRFLPPKEKREVAQRLDFTPVPSYGEFQISAPDFTNTLNELLKRESCLGGPIEGIVLKPRDGNVFGVDGKLLIAKIVRAEFRERHAKEWGEANPSKNDVIAKLIVALRTEARWRKVIQHLRDDGTLQGSMRDIPVLLEELSADTLREEKDYIASALWKFAWPQIERGLRRGLPEFYKAQLLNEQIGEADARSVEPNC